MNHNLGLAGKNYQKKGRNENTGRLPCYRLIVIEKDWKTTVHLLADYATDVEQSS